MPICENKNKGTSIAAAGDIDHHHSADAAKVMKSREQAYFNSYDFDAIEELPYEEKNVVILNEKKLSSGKQQVSATAAAATATASADIGLDLGALSNAYLKRLTSYFTTPNRTRQSIKNRSNNIVDVECDGQSRSERSNSSSSSSAGSSRTLYSSHKMGGNAVTTQKGINNFLLPRAMLKYQSAIATNPMPVSGTTNNANSSSINKVNSITCINGSGTKGGNNRQLQSASGTGDSGFSGVVVHGNGYEKNDHERVISSSHYSTEKSGSSGYYSSNLCSTSSVEEHIYSEPVIDVLEQRGIPTLLKSSLPIKTTTKILSGKLQDDEDDDIICGESHCDINTVIVTTSTNTKTLLTKTGPSIIIKANEDLRTLETSIENLDRHLKSYPKFVVVGQQQLQQQLHHHNNHHQHQHPHLQRTTSFTQCTDEQCLQEFENSKRRQLPTIMEGIDNNPSPLKTDNTWSDDMDDSLMDIDLDSFLLANEMAKKANKVTNMKGIDNPNFNKTEVLNDEALENNYKCSKYVNSCPEDAYNVESVIEGVDTDLPDKSLAFFLKKYEDQLHFQSTKDMLEDIRERLRALILAAASSNEDRIIPNDLEKNIATLKQELETYLRIMNRNSEMEIKQFCAGLTNNQKLVTMTKAFERRKSLTSDTDYEIDYEPIRAVTCDSVNQYNLESITPDIGSVKCSDPNFKLKRKSITEIFPMINECGSGGGNAGAGGSIGSIGIAGDMNSASVGDNYVIGRFNDELFDEERSSAEGASAKNILNVTQLQRNLSYQRPKLDKSDMKKSSKSEDDKNSILEWHRNRPSIWELYYGTNRLNQTLSGKKGQLVKNTTSVMSYPSSRPESDFTLDLPRAEQLRLKMEKEKKFRHRCRILTTFLSLVFFLLTVMIVSLVLTRGKRMFGSML